MLYLHLSFIIGYVLCTTSYTPEFNMHFKYFSNSIHILTFLLLFSSFPVSCVRNRDINALSDQEYDIMVRKILGSFDKPVTDRTNLDTVVIRKYYRWMRQGHDVTVGAGGRTMSFKAKFVLFNVKMSFGNKLSHLALKR